MFSFKLLFVFALAIACVVAFPEEARRVRKQVFYGSYPYAYNAYSAPLAYSAYSGYTGYPYYY